jgi:hypothetical protein
MDQVLTGVLYSERQTDWPILFAIEAAFVRLQHQI